MNNKVNIAVIPLDNRPISYTFPEILGEIHTGINIILPPRELIGGLTTPANPQNVLCWLENTVSSTEVDFIVCSLDTIAYGGLIPSRWCEDGGNTILSRLQRLKEIVEPLECGIFGFSSIMRISNGNNNEEEKPYWDKYGKLIFEYSSLKHKQEMFPDEIPINTRLKELKALIPVDIIEDYLKIRQRNFNINKIYLNYLNEGLFDFLVYGKDDTAAVGLNIQEAELLQKEIEAKNLVEKAILNTGADEIITMLIARAVSETFNGKIEIFPVYSTSTGPEIIPKYGDKSLRETIKASLAVCGVNQASSQAGADMIILLHTPDKNQNDYALQEFTESENGQAVGFCIETLKNINKPVTLADVKNANGADNLLIEKLLPKEEVLKKLYGYAGWNTAGNSIGSALATGIFRYAAEKQFCFSAGGFNKLMFIRFADDWAYQGIVRQLIRAVSEKADEVLLNRELIPLTDRIAPKFNINPDRVIVSFPWDRTFEVEINLLQ